jgi:hypothetical protein
MTQFEAHENRHMHALAGIRHEFEAIERSAMFVANGSASHGFSNQTGSTIRGIRHELRMDAGPAQLFSGRRSEAPGFGASDESAEDWSQADSQSPWSY